MTAHALPAACAALALATTLHPHERAGARPAGSPATVLSCLPRLQQRPSASCNPLRPRNSIREAQPARRQNRHRQPPLQPTHLETHPGGRRCSLAPAHPPPLGAPLGVPAPCDRERRSRTSAKSIQAGRTDVAHGLLTAALTEPAAALLPALLAPCAQPQRSWQPVGSPRTAKAGDLAALALQPACAVTLHLPHVHT